MDYSPKCQFFKILSQLTTVYILTSYKTVSIETPTQHSIYGILSYERSIVILFVHNECSEIPLEK